MKRRGLTLLELVVVMVILVALAGILVPLLPGLLGKAHKSTGTTNLTELDKLMDTYFTAHLKYPDTFDSLVDGTGLYTKLAGYSGSGATATAAGGQVTCAALTASQSAALVQAGIKTLLGMKSTSITNATFDCYDTSKDITLTATSEDKVAWAQPARVHELFGWGTATDTGNMYVILGIGHHSTAVGKGGVMRDAPIHFGDEAGSSPADVYQRFAVIFDVTGDVAKYVGAVAIHGGKRDSARTPLQGYWSDE